MSIDTVRIAAALRVLADAIDGTPAQGVEVPAGTPSAAVEPPRRGRGRPAKGESLPAPASAAPAASPAATEPADPFAEAPAQPPTASLEDVRAALVALKDRTDQATALKVLAEAGGAKTLGELKADKYGAVVAAANGYGQTAEPEDPFAAPAAKTAEPEKVPTLEEVRAVIVETQKRTAADTVQKLIMELGGKGPNAQGVEAPKLSALPVSKYAEAVARLKALPSTK